MDTGDETLHTEKIWQERMNLSTDPLIADELHNWWIMVRASFGNPKKPLSFEGTCTYHHPPLSLAFSLPPHRRSR